MSARHRRSSLLRQARFESFEERLALSAQPVADFYLASQVEQRIEMHLEQLEQHIEDLQDLDDGAAREITHHTGQLEQHLGDAHDATGVNYVYNTYGFTGTGQTVAVIDSGIAWDHVALGGGLGTSYRVVGGWDFAENDADPYDDAPEGFHGTHVAGIIGSSNSTYRGVAPDVDLVSLRVFDDDGAGYFSWVESALQWVHDHRNDFANPITTVNMSLGTDWNSDSIPNWTTIEDELALLEQDGLFIAVSAGNSFAAYNTPGLSYPAASPYVVPVASVTNGGAFSSFSQRHDRVIAAPGSSITSTVPDYLFGADGNPNDFGTASGTSMASPYVAGASVLIRQAMEFVGLNNITQDTIYDHIRDTADIFYDTATDANYHRLNVQAALEALMPVDDYGSTEAAAHVMGTISGQTSVSGLIGTLDDVDYFTFTAGVTGTATVTLDASNINLIADGDVSQASTTSFTVVAGQSYTVAAQSDGELEFYGLGIEVEAALDATALLDATTWNGEEAFTRTARYGTFTGDDLVAVDVAKSYQLSGAARSGDDEGNAYQQNNAQYFGFASYDIDGNAIRAYHVRKFTGAADTRLAQSLRAGDTQIVLEDASGWSNGGAAHQRSFAWYGYADSSGHVYDDYTYTRNVQFSNAWDAGAIDYATNTITLATPWDGPEIDAGVAVRNAQAGANYNYAALNGGEVPNEWTSYEATISGVSAADATSFRPGTAYIKPLLLTNYHGQNGNLITWQDVKVCPTEAFAAGEQVDLTIASLEMPNVTYAWTQLSGPGVELLHANTATASLTTPSQPLDYDLSFQVTVDSGQFSATDTVNIHVTGDGMIVDATALLDATTWNGEEAFTRTARYGTFTGDDLVAVDVAKSYQLSGSARSGDDEGNAYQQNNAQYFGFASYDVDGNAIRAYHVRKFTGAADTRLAQSLRAGDTQIVLEDASGWSNGGAAHQRSFAWYGYADSSGHVYDDYTYTRNVQFSNAWDAGAIDYATNTITLATPWDGPEIDAGVAVRNAQAGANYNYAALNGGEVPNEWTSYEATISGVSATDATSFRPGTAYIKPLLLTNYHGQNGNLITWQDVKVCPTEAFAAGEQVDLTIASLEMPNVTYAWTQLSGPGVELLHANTATASLTTPSQPLDYDLSFQVTVDSGQFSATDTVNIHVTGDGMIVDATALLDATTWNGEEAFTRTARYGTFTGDDLVAVDVAKSYQLSGAARSGDDEGNAYQQNNAQYFGFASYDIDGNAIRAYHVRKFTGAADTRLAQSLRAGDTQIVLEDASGWSNGGAAHQRSFAWYGYADSSGHVYDDYTYTRNVQFSNAWDAGAIDYATNTITLATPWDGPEIDAGVAVRNAQAGANYNYAALNGGEVPNEWTSYEATISGVSATDATSFRPGTAYIKPLLLTNYHGQNGNLITWQDVKVCPTETFAAGEQVDLTIASLEMPNVTYAWTQLSGPGVELLHANTATASLTTPSQPLDYDLSFQVTVDSGQFSATDTVNIHVTGDGTTTEATALFDGAAFDGAAARQGIPRIWTAFADSAREHSQRTTSEIDGLVRGRFVAETSILPAREIETSQGVRLRDAPSQFSTHGRDGHNLVPGNAAEGVRQKARGKYENDDAHSGMFEKGVLSELAALDRLFSILERLD